MIKTSRCHGRLLKTSLLLVSVAVMMTLLFLSMTDSGSLINYFSRHNGSIGMEKIKTLLFWSLSQASGLQWLSEEFGLCTALKSKNDVAGFKSWLQETWVNLAMVDYPYEANFLQPLPPWPIQVT